MSFPQKRESRLIALETYDNKMMDSCLRRNDERVGLIKSRQGLMMNPSDFKLAGFLFSGISAGIKKDGKRDLGLIYSQVPAQVAGLFTTNAVKAAPVQLGMKRIKRGLCRAVIINSGNANACTGRRGLEDAKRTSSWAAKGLGTEETLIIPSSTGVIGIPLPMEKIEEGIPKLINALSPDGWMDTVEAIMKTDTFPKAEMVNC